MLEFSPHTKRRAMSKVRQLNQDNPAELERQTDATRRDIAAGVFSFGSPACLLSCRSLVGIKKLLHLTINKNHPDVDEAFIDRLFDAKADEAATAMNQAAGADTPDEGDGPKAAASPAGG